MCQCFCGTCCKWHVQCASRVAATCQTCRRSSRVSSSSSDKALSVAFFAQRKARRDEGRNAGQARQRCLVHKSQEAGRRMKVAGRQDAGRQVTGRRQRQRQASDGTVTGRRRDCYQRHATCGRGRCALLGLQMCVQSVADDTATTLSDPPA